MLTFISVCQEGSVASLKYVIALSPCTARSPLLWQWPAFQYNLHHVELSTLQH